MRLCKAMALYTPLHVEHEVRFDATTRSPRPKVISLSLHWRGRKGVKHQFGRGEGRTYSRHHTTRQSIQTLPLATDTTDNKSTLLKQSRYSLPRFRQEPPIAL